VGGSFSRQDARHELFDGDEGHAEARVSELLVEARRFEPGDEEQLAEGFERSAGAGATRRSLAELRWRYGAAPHGACVAFARDASGTVLAGIAATRHRARLEQSEVFWLEVGDLFNDFARSAGLARARGLLAAGKAFAETFGGFPPDRHPVMYGLPSRRAHRIGLAALEWEVLRSENELVLDLARASLPAAPEVEPAEVARFPEEIARASAAAAAGRSALLLRDAAYLNWRYVERPGASFALALARRGAEPVGFAVLRAGVLHELCAAAEDEPVRRALLSWAAARTRAEGGATLAAVVPDTAPEFLLLQRAGFRVHGTREYLCFRSFQRPAIMSWLYQHWSYSRGDTLR
jgi:hypothetical protein